MHVLVQCHKLSNTLVQYTEKSITTLYTCAILQNSTLKIHLSYYLKYKFCDMRHINFKQWHTKKSDNNEKGGKKKRKRQQNPNLYKKLNENFKSNIKVFKVFGMRMPFHI